MSTELDVLALSFEPALSQTVVTVADRLVVQQELSDQLKAHVPEIRGVSVLGNVAVVTVPRGVPAQVVLALVQHGAVIISHKTVQHVAKVSSSSNDSSSDSGSDDTTLYIIGGAVLGLLLIISVIVLLFMVITLRSNRQVQTYTAPQKARERDNLALPQYITDRHQQNPAYDASDMDDDNYTDLALSETSLSQDGVSLNGVQLSSEYGDLENSYAI